MDLFSNIPPRDIQEEGYTSSHIGGICVTVTAKSNKDPYQLVLLPSLHQGHGAVSDLRFLVNQHLISQLPLKEIGT